MLRRRAVAAVEFALILPIIVLLMLGSVELGRGVMVQHALQEAAQAGCRLYTILDADQKDVDDIIAQAMSIAGISDYTVSFKSASKGAIKKDLEPVTVTISVNYNKVAWLSPEFLSDATIAESCTLPADLDLVFNDPNTKKNKKNIKTKKNKKDINTKMNKKTTFDKRAEDKKKRDDKKKADKKKRDDKKKKK
jgi:hypothetical protein